MLRHFAYGWRTFVKVPDVEPKRINWEFFAVLKGRCAPHFVGERFPKLKSSTLWLLPPQCEYSWKSEKRSSLRVFFQVANLPEIMIRNLPGKHYYEVQITRRQGERILELAKEIEPYFFNPDEAYDLRVNHLMIELCLMILGNVRLSADTPLHLISLKRVQKAETFYQENLSRKPTLYEVAAHVGISQSQLRRDFEKVRYQAPQTVFSSLRLQESCSLLLNTTQTNDLIARQAGFGSTIDFHRTFKAKMGVTPHYWRTHTKVKG